MTSNNPSTDKLGGKPGRVLRSSSYTEPASPTKISGPWPRSPTTSNRDPSSTLTHHKSPLSPKQDRLKKDQQSRRRSNSGITNKDVYKAKLPSPRSKPSLKDNRPRPRSGANYSDDSEDLDEVDFRPRSTSCQVGATPSSLPASTENKGHMMDIFPQISLGMQQKYLELKSDMAQLEEKSKAYEAELELLQNSKTILQLFELKDRMEGVVSPSESFANSAPNSFSKNSSRFSTIKNMARPLTPSFFRPPSSAEEISRSQSPTPHLPGRATQILLTELQGMVDIGAKLVAEVTELKSKADVEVSKRSHTEARFHQLEERLLHFGAVEEKLRQSQEDLWKECQQNEKHTAKRQELQAQLKTLLNHERTYKTKIESNSEEIERLRLEVQAVKESSLELQNKYDAESASHRKTVVSSAREARLQQDKIRTLERELAEAQKVKPLNTVHESRDVATTDESPVPAPPVTATENGVSSNSGSEPIADVTLPPLHFNSEALNEKNSRLVKSLQRIETAKKRYKKKVDEQQKLLEQCRVKIQQLMEGVTSQGISEDEKWDWDLPHFGQAPLSASESDLLSDSELPAEFMQPNHFKSNFDADPAKSHPNHSLSEQGHHTDSDVSRTSSTRPRTLERAKDLKSQLSEKRPSPRRRVVRKIRRSNSNSSNASSCGGASVPTSFAAELRLSHSVEPPPNPIIVKIAHLVATSLASTSLPELYSPTSPVPQFLSGTYSPPPEMALNLSETEVTQIAEKILKELRAPSGQTGDIQDVTSAVDNAIPILSSHPFTNNPTSDPCNSSIPPPTVDFRSTSPLNRPRPSVLDRSSSVGERGHVLSTHPAQSAPETLSPSAMSSHDASDPQQIPGDVSNISVMTPDSVKQTFDVLPPSAVAPNTSSPTVPNSKHASEATGDDLPIFSAAITSIVSPSVQASQESTEATNDDLPIFSSTTTSISSHPSLSRSQKRLGDEAGVNSNTSIPALTRSQNSLRAKAKVNSISSIPALSRSQKGAEGEMGVSPISQDSGSSGDHQIKSHDEVKQDLPSSSLSAKVSDVLSHDTSVISSTLPQRTTDELVDSVTVPMISDPSLSHPQEKSNLEVGCDISTDRPITLGDVQNHPHDDSKGGSKLLETSGLTSHPVVSTAEPRSSDSHHGHTALITDATPIPSISYSATKRLPGVDVGVQCSLAPTPDVAMLPAGTMTSASPPQSQPIASKVSDQVAHSPTTPPLNEVNASHGKQEISLTNEVKASHDKQETASLNEVNASLDKQETSLSNEVNPAQTKQEISLPSGANSSNDKLASPPLKEVILTSSKPEAPSSTEVTTSHSKPETSSPEVLTRDPSHKSMGSLDLLSQVPSSSVDDTISREGSPQIYLPDLDVGTTLDSDVLSGTCSDPYYKVLVDSPHARYALHKEAAMGTVPPLESRTAQLTYRHPGENHIWQCLEAVEASATKLHSSSQSPLHEELHASLVQLKMALQIPQEHGSSSSLQLTNSLTSPPVPPSHALEVPSDVSASGSLELKPRPSSRKSFSSQISSFFNSSGRVNRSSPAAQREALGPIHRSTGQDDAETPKDLELMSPHMDLTLSPKSNAPVDQVVLSMIHAMSGEFLHKFVRKTTFTTESVHLRFFWLNPYTRVLAWARREPHFALGTRSPRQVYVTRVEEVDNAYHHPTMNEDSTRAINIYTSSRVITVKASSLAYHEMWLAALSYVQSHDTKEASKYTRERHWNSFKSRENSFVMGGDVRSMRTSAMSRSSSRAESCGTRRDPEDIPRPGSSACSHSEEVIDPLSQHSSREHLTTPKFSSLAAPHDRTSRPTSPALSQRNHPSYSLLFASTITKTHSNSSGHPAP